MSKESAAKYRRTAARLIYLVLFNSLIAFVSKEASRSMSSQRQGKEVKLKRILGFLRKKLTTTFPYEWQDQSGELSGYTDSHCAGCKLTRRSASGGVILHRSHLLLHYSRTQAGVALSSAEAELNAALTLGCEILGICQFCQDQRRFICSKRHLGAPWMREGEALGGETARAPRAGALEKLTSTRSLA